MKSIILAHWKEGTTEAYSSLVSFCSKNPQYNYETLRYHIGRKKVNFEDEKVRIERKKIIKKVLGKVGNNN